MMMLVMMMMISFWPASHFFKYLNILLYDNNISFTNLSNFRTSYNFYPFLLAALANGFDSIQRSFTNEVIICNGNCATQSFNSACPNTTMLTVYEQNKQCFCNTRTHILNCGLNIEKGDIFNDQATSYPGTKSCRRGWQGLYQRSATNGTSCSTGTGSIRRRHPWLLLLIGT